VINVPPGTAPRGRGRLKNKTVPGLPDGKTPGGPKGLPPGLGGAARRGGVGAPGQADGGRVAMVAKLRARRAAKRSG
jgi:hypothetical protein